MKARGSAYTHIFLHGSIVLVFLVIMLFAPSIARAVVISEICSNNATAYETKAGDTPDWIELYNPEASDVDLTGYYISNDINNPQKFELNGYTIKAGGYLVLCADLRELPFKLSASGSEVSLTGGGEVSVPPLACNETYSLQPDGKYQITAPTPLSENTAGRDYEAPVFVRTPEFSVETGLYDEPFDLEISGYQGDTIYYTLDGSVPDADSEIYSGSLKIIDRSNWQNKYSALTATTFETIIPPTILLSKMTVIRAAAMDAAGNWSETATRVYGVGLKGKGVIDDMPVLMITVDPADMFDENDGIYMLGKEYYQWINAKMEANPDFDITTIVASARGANFNLHGRLNEILANVQYIDESGTARLSQNLGLRIRGNFSRALPNKSLQLYARGEYDGGKIEYEFWEGAGKPEQLTVRNGGNDQVLLYRDSFAHTLLEPLGVPVSRSIPCALYINGEYWGVYNLREEQNADYIAERYGVYADDVVMIKNFEIDEGYGDELSLYSDFLRELRALDCSKPEDYARACELMDVDNYVSYLAGELFVGCTDWLNFQNNMTYWRTRSEGGKWRWIYQDMDHSSGWVEAKPTPVQSLLNDDVFSLLWPSPKFQTKFLGMVMDTAYIVCNKARTIALINEFDAKYRQYAKLKYARFGYPYSLTDYNNSVSNMIAFYEDRAASLAEQLSVALSLERTLCDITIIDSGVQGAEIYVDGFKIDCEDRKWQGVFFSDCPISVAAGDVAGYDFTGWYAGNELVSESPEMTTSLSDKLTLTPRYSHHDSCAVISSEFAPTSASDGEYRIVSYTGEATLMPDAGLTLASENGTYTIAPEVKWEKKQGLTLRLSTIGTRNLYITIDASAGSDAPEKWQLLYSTDGDKYEEIYKGEQINKVELPAELNDSAEAYLRIEVSGKPQKGDEQAIVISTFEVYGEKMNASLLDVHNCMDACEAAMGDEFMRISDEELSKMTESELHKYTENCYTALAAFTVNLTMREISGADISALPALEGMEGATRFSITAEVEGMATYISQKTGLKGEAYLHIIENGKLFFLGTYEVLDGTLTLPASAGDYVLLEKPMDDYRYSVSYSNEAIDDVIIANALAGENPDRHIWIDVTLYTAYQDSILLNPPEEYGLKQNLYLYTIYGDTLSEAARLEDNGTGNFIAEGLNAGRYLALDEPKEWYTETLLMREEAETQRIAEQQRSKALKRNMLIAAGALITIIAAAIIIRALIRRRGKQS